MWAISLQANAITPGGGERWLRSVRATTTRKTCRFDGYSDFSNPPQVAVSWFDGHVQ